MHFPERGKIGTSLCVTDDMARQDRMSVTSGFLRRAFGLASTCTTPPFLMGPFSFPTFFDFLRSWNFKFHPSAHRSSWPLSRFLCLPPECPPGLPRVLMGMAGLGRPGAAAASASAGSCLAQAQTLQAQAPRFALGGI